MLTSLKDLIQAAVKGKYAVGAFNTHNLETTLGIIRAAVDMKSPTIIQISETTIEYAGLKPITHIVQTLAKNAVVSIPIALHLDHGKSFRSVAECINAGFSSIMIDASDVPYDENVILTKQAVEYAHKRGVWAQGELGRVRGSEDMAQASDKEAFLTDPDQALDFVTKTGVDTLAVSVGNVHGIYKMQKGVPKLDLDRLEQIHKKVGNLPLVLHGASGLPEDQVRAAVERGVVIINIDTELRMAFSESLRKTLQENPAMYDPRDILEPSIGAVQQVVIKKMEMFGSRNKG